MFSIGKKIRFLKNCWNKLLGVANEEVTLYRLGNKYDGFKYEQNVQIKSPERLTLGRNVVIQRNAIIHCGGFEWSDYKGKVELYDNVVISSNAMIIGTGEVVVREFTHVGPGAKLMSQSPNPKGDLLSSKTPLIFDPIKIGKGCHIGSGAVICGGTELGDFCIVGPNSVVKGKYQDKSILIGNPARCSISG